MRGVVKSDKMDKTISVEVERLVKHPHYGKYVRRHSRFLVHDPRNEATEGDVVEIESTRPLSRRKRWRLVRVMRRKAAPGPVIPAETEGAIPETGL
jgi:small subunit ribosomal protein S17